MLPENKKEDVIHIENLLEEQKMLRKNIKREKQRQKHEREWEETIEELEDYGLDGKTLNKLKRG